jgi:uncharacterized membrane protein
MDQNRLPGWYLWICLSRSWALPQNTAWNRTSIVSHLNVWLIQSCCVGFLIILLFIFAYYYSVLKIILARLLISLIMLWLSSISQQELNEALTPTLRWLSVFRLLTCTCLHFKNFNYYLLCILPYILSQYNNLLICTLWWLILQIVRKIVNYQP